MNPNDFKVLHSELISYFQYIEHDLKLIYAYMHKGDVIDNFESLERKNLGNMINELKDLDNSDGNPYISASDYNFLKQMKDKRNYWCHQAYIDFAYEDECWNSREFDKISLRLKKDHDKLSVVCRNVEKVRLKIVKEYDR